MRPGGLRYTELVLYFTITLDKHAPCINMKPARPIGAVLLLAAIAALPGCGIGEASVSDANEVRAAAPVPVEVALPERATIFATYFVTATVESDSDAPVLARVGGEIVDLLAEEGDRVEAGQVLARLDGERLRLEMLLARAELEKTRKEFARYEDLAARGLVSAAMYEDLKYDLAALQAGYDLTRLEYDYSFIRAPISGIVTKREVKLGQNVTADFVTFRITDPTELVAYLQVPQTELVKFEAGLDASLAVDAIADATFQATIERISPTIDTRNGTFRATALIDNSAGNLVPGMFARFTIAYEEHDNALIVPRKAVLFEDDETTVYVVRDGEVTRRNIETGIVSETSVEVLAGLDESDEIVVVGHAGLRDGSKVLANNQTKDSFTG